ncbi:glycosyltransferase [Pseudoalteromonas sp. SMS1]|uniref:glycosyltransferase family 4 protein n=1 Tax=Pseudoalteromonas sp. SMS1 TaxID=2908894 RepID=UPI001F476C18|nr:glycosyltransferase [Pseudoalteromonas sp. SMS1]MCF2855887.1 glycosyltransferase [Pseudoalteromonas sp. SMS1]
MKHIAIYTDSKDLQEVAILISEANALADVGHQVTIISHVKYKNVRNLKPAVSIKYIDSNAMLGLLGLASNFRSFIKCLSIWYKYKAVNLYTLITNGLALANMLRQANVEHVHTGFKETMYPVSLASATCVGASISHFCNNRITKSSAKCIAETCNVSFLELDRVPSAKNSNTIVLKRGLDLTQYKPTIKNKRFVKLVFVGNIVEGAGLFTLLKALAALPSRAEIQLDVVGTGPIKKKLVNELIKLRLNQKVHFLGEKPRKWIVQNLSKYNAMISPYNSDSAVMEVNNINYIKEAMACSLPILTSNIETCEELTSLGTGMRCPPDSVDALKNMLLAFVKLGPYNQHLLGESARKYAEKHYNVKHQARALSDCIQAL